MVSKLEKSKSHPIKAVMADSPPNLIIFDSLVKAGATVPKYKNVAVGISGGSDSDVVIDIMKKIFFDTTLHFVWFDTGVEYQGTKDHLDHLEKKYDTKIQRIRAIKPIPMSIREYGAPFLNKYASEMIQRLQSHNFDFGASGDWTFEEAWERYPKCKVALRWFTNNNENKYNDDGSIKTISQYNIMRNKYLREFLISHPPKFKISNKCCTWAKKKVADKFIKENNIDLNVIGVRRSEGGIRSTAYSTCFDRRLGKDVSNYRPIFWYSDVDKLEYNVHYDIINSICYSKYGLARTGCSGCPFGRDFEQELDIIETHEPKLFGAVNKIFKDSYEYTRAYREFRKSKENK